MARFPCAPYTTRIPCVPALPGRSAAGFVAPCLKFVCHSFLCVSFIPSLPATMAGISVRAMIVQYSSAAGDLRQLTSSFVLLHDPSSKCWHTGSCLHTPAGSPLSRHLLRHSLRVVPYFATSSQGQYFSFSHVPAIRTISISIIIGSLRLSNHHLLLTHSSDRKQ